MSNFEEAYLHNLSPDNATTYAQGFTTGDYIESYVLTSIDVMAFDTGTAQPANIKGELRSALAGGGPSGTVVANLTIQTTAVAAGPISFQAPAGTRLAANTTYYFVVYTDNTDYMNLTTTASKAEVFHDTFGGSIENKSYFKTTGNWDSNPGDGVLHIRVNGVPVELSLEVKYGDQRLGIGPYGDLGNPTDTYVRYVQASPTMENLSLTLSWRAGAIESNPTATVHYYLTGLAGTTLTWNKDDNSDTTRTLNLHSTGVPGFPRVTLSAGAGIEYTIIFQNNGRWEFHNNNLLDRLQMKSAGP